MSLLDPASLVGVGQTLQQRALIGGVLSAALLPPAVSIPSAGHVASLAWRGVPGATGARVGTSTLVVVPKLQGTRDLGVVAGGATNTDSITVQSPVAEARLRQLHIPNLVRAADDAALDSPAALASLGLRLALAPIVDGDLKAPVVVVPQLPATGAVPAQLVGGTVQGSVFVLPDVVGDRFLVTVVEGDAPGDFNRVLFSHGDVRMHAAPSPVGLHVDGPDGAELHRIAGPLMTAALVDMTAAVQRHLDAVVGTGEVSADLTVRSDATGMASVLWTTDGVIVRALDDRLTVEVLGMATVVPVSPPSPTRPPLSALGTITVTHHGSALHPISDPVPAGEAGHGGPVVRDAPVVRNLPPLALVDHQITQVGVVGWVLADGDLTVDVLGRTAEVTGLVAPLGRSAPEVVWLRFTESVPVEGPVTISLTATRGAFGWLADPDPLVRIAVTSAAEGHIVTVGGQPIALTGQETVAVDRPLLGDVVSAGGGWTVQTDQFCSVTLSGIVMEFAP